jgi:hypothetical protein
MSIKLSDIRRIVASVVRNISQVLPEIGRRIPPLRDDPL